MRELFPIEPLFGREFTLPRKVNFASLQGLKKKRREKARYRDKAIESASTHIHINVPCTICVSCAK